VNEVLKNVFGSTKEEEERQENGTNNVQILVAMREDNETFNLFHVRALYYTNTLITNKMHKESFIINCNTLLHVSTLAGHLQGELFVIVTLSLHFIVE
jgi:hypothetical protein